MTSRKDDEELTHILARMQMHQQLATIQLKDLKQQAKDKLSSPQVLLTALAAGFLIIRLSRSRSTKPAEQNTVQNKSGFITKIMRIFGLSTTAVKLLPRAKDLFTKLTQSKSAKPNLAVPSPPDL